jgi:hypothetical protein
VRPRLYYRGSDGNQIPVEVGAQLLPLPLICRVEVAAQLGVKLAKKVKAALDELRIGLSHLTHEGGGASAAQRTLSSAANTRLSS